MTPMEALQHHVSVHPTDLAFRAKDEIWTYERLATESRRLARGLAARGFNRGDRIALHMMNRPAMLVAYYACFQLGIIAAPLRTAFKSAELGPMLQRLQPSLYIGETSLYENVVDIDSSIIAPHLRFLIDVDASDPQCWNHLFKNLNDGSVSLEPDVHAPAVLINTSGTTGQPKFVIHTPMTLSKGMKSINVLEIDEGQISIVATSLAHASGLYMFLASIQSGVPFILFEQFEADAVLNAIEHYSCTTYWGMPWSFAALLDRQRTHQRNVASLRHCWAVGDACPVQLQEQFLACFGVALRAMWASTEATGSLTYGLVLGPVSRVLMGAQIQLVDDEGLPVLHGKVGELLLRGPNVSPGYWIAPGHIDNVSLDGWFHTGDLMQEVREGELSFVSRKKDIIVRGGTNISPVEVEDVLMSAHPAVAEAAVIGIPDPVLGQRVVGFVKLKDAEGQQVLEAIRTAASARLADYKVPEWLKIVDEIPRNALGKLDRQSLRNLI